MFRATTILKFNYILSICICLVLSGCVPGLRVGIARQHKLEDVNIEIASRGKHSEKIEFLLRNQIERYVRHTEDVSQEMHERSRYKLSIEYATYEETYAIQSNTIAKRQKAGLRIWYTLISLPDGILVSEGKISRSGSFDIEDSTYSTYVARVQEWENLIYPIVDEMLTNISVDLN